MWVQILYTHCMPTQYVQRSVSRWLRIGYFKQLPTKETSCKQTYADMSSLTGKNCFENKPPRKLPAVNEKTATQNSRAHYSSEQNSNEICKKNTSWDLRLHTFYTFMTGWCPENSTVKELLEIWRKIQFLFCRDLVFFFFLIIHWIILLKCSSHPCEMWRNLAWNTSEA